MKVAKENGTQLSDDILITIFVLCSDGIALPPELNKPPWTFTRVCSKWRRIAVGTSELWSDIKFHIISTGRVGKNLASLEARIVDRCNGRLISISNQSAFMVGSSLDMSSTHFINQFVLPFSSTLGRLDLKGGPGSVQALFSSPAGSLPLLEELNICLEEKTHCLGRWADSALSLQHSSALRRVSFRRRFLIFDPTILVLPWDQLESLIFRNVDLPTKSLHDFLPLCQHLVNFRTDTGWISSSSDSKPIILPSLSSFDVTISEEEVISYLKFPNLQFLTLRLHRRLWSPQGFTAFAQSSCLHLQGINLVFTLAYQGEVKDILDQIANEFSTLQPPITTGRFLCPAVPTLTHQQLARGFPNLRHIVSDSASTAIVLDVLNVVETYYQEFGKLETATVIIRKEAPQESVEKAECLREKGLDVRFPWFTPNWDDSVQWTQ